MNTIGNWSDAANLRAAQNALHGHGIRAGKAFKRRSEGYWGKFADVFDPGFADAVRRAVAAAQGQSGRRSLVPGLFRRQRTGAGATRFRWPWPRWPRPPTSRPRRLFSTTCRRSTRRSSGSTQPGAHDHASWDALLESHDAARRQEGPRTTWPPSTQYGRAILPRLPRRGQGSRSARALPGLPLCLGQRSGGPRGGQVLRRGQLQPLPAERGRPAPARGRGQAGHHRRVPLRRPGPRHVPHRPGAHGQPGRSGPRPTSSTSQSAWPIR